MAAPASSRPRISVDGKFFRLGESKFFVQGLAYGPFAENGNGEPFPLPAQVAKDFAQIRELGANLVRVYHVPPRWFLDLAEQHGLKVMVDVPWAKHICFLDGEDTRSAARSAVREAATACAMHPAVFAISVVNEIPSDIVRWSGPARIAAFIEELIEVVKAVDAECLCTFANYPTTEYLHAQNVDFICFNVYLHHQKPFENYLARLQMNADAKPLLLGEFGIDSIREGEARQAEILRWQIETAFRGGVAGAVVFSYTDDWHKGGRHVNDWAFGLTTRERQPKPAFAAVSDTFKAAPYFPLHYSPMVSVVVACYNGERTLKTCLDSLERLNYPSYEVILVDDGSTDSTPQIASLYPKIRYLRHDNLGLSAARNTGIQAAQGEIVAFTDADCRADEDWLYYLVGDLVNSRFTGIGGHNFLPPEDSWIASAVMVSPGGPAHVMLTDRVAEHIPGCNMAFYKWALDEIGGFDPIFRLAGDDVDVCWRLQQRGYKIGFSPAGFVWHYRRSTAQAYLKQQKGYGEAEALLVRKHPEYFNSFGGSIWQGRIYTPARIGIVIRPPMIYHGAFGSAFFQSIYTAAPSMWLMLLTSLEYHLFITIPLFVLGTVFTTLLPLGITSLLVSVTLCVAAAVQADIPKKKRQFWSRPLVALLFFLQPIVRGSARHQGRLLLNQAPLSAHETLDTLDLKHQGKNFEVVQYWSEKGIDRMDFLRRVLEQLDKDGWQNKTDAGWSAYDVEIYGSRWCNLQLVLASEAHASGKQLLRCRLRTAWSLLAQIVFCTTMAIELLLIGVVGPVRGLVFVLVLSLVSFIWLLYSEQRDLQRIMAVFLDKVAKQAALTKIELPAPEKKPAAAQEAQKP
ncbi:MAG: glycosyltransferase [Verrucomicrobiota bacterium]